MSHVAQCGLSQPELARADITLRIQAISAALGLEGVARRA